MSLEGLVAKLHKAEKSPIYEFAVRYGGSYFLSSAAAVAGAYLGDYIFHSPVASGIVGTLFETIANVGYMFALDYNREMSYLKEQRKHLIADTYNKDVDKALLSKPPYKKILRNLACELGAAELFDITFVRPWSISLSVKYLGPVAGGAAGVTIADALYYTVAYCSHKFFNRKTNHYNSSNSPST